MSIQQNQPQNQEISGKILPSTKQLVQKYQLQASKALGQNFIFDENFTAKIAKAAGDLGDSVVLEIGAGPGGLTRALLNAGVKQVIAIEKDQKCLAALEELREFYGSKLEIINADALEFDEIAYFKRFFEISVASNQNQTSKINNKFKIIANLPYNIGTPLLIKWLKISDFIDSMTLMLQKEVVERITAKTGSKAFGRLAVISNFVCETKMLFAVSPQVFTPMPKVVSAIVSLVPRSKKIADISIQQLEKLTAVAFNQRRKMLKSGLKPLFPEVSEVLKAAQINENLRPEQISIEEFCRLAALIPK